MSKEKVIILSLVLMLISISGCRNSDNWGWKRAQTPDDVMSFINGTGAYSFPASEAKICAVWRDSYNDFIVFYQRQENENPKGTWGWKLATDTQDAYNFVNGLGAYQQPVKDFKICAIWKGNHIEFFIFYLAGGIEQPASRWGWKMATTPDDAMNFLNGQGAYKEPVTTARIAMLNRGNHSEFYIFYQRAMGGEPIPNWAWKKSTDPDDVRNFLSGQGSYSKPIDGCEICSQWNTSHTEYYVFYNKGTRIWLQNPLKNERFVKNEKTEFRAFVTSDIPVDGSQLQWNSSIDGNLGSGPSVEINGLSVGNHAIQLSGYGMIRSVAIRVYNDLWELYQTSPSQEEIQRIENDFTFNLVDGTAADEKWNLYEPAVFDQSSTFPAKIVAISKLDILRHQRFSEPLPFTGGKTAYENFRTHVNTINLRLDCNLNYGGGGAVDLSRPFCVWDGRSSGTASDPYACKTPFANPTLYKYINPLYLILHEGRHSEPGESGHTSCNGKSNMDPSLENGSGHARAALYLMWVYKYGIYDPQVIRSDAKSIAAMLLSNRFCTTPAHSNPKVQAIVNELLQ